MDDEATHKTARMGAGYRPDRVRTLRKALGLDQSALAKKAGTDQGDISRIERGVTKRATGINAERKLALLAKALGTTTDDIYERVAIDGPELHLDPVDPAPPASARGPMEGALLTLAGTDPEGPYDFEDVDVVREAIRETARYMEDTDSVEIVRSWLRSARYFRLRNVKPTTAQVIARAQGGVSLRSERAHVEATERTQDEAEAKARALGMDTGRAPSARAVAARERATATSKKRTGG